MVTEVRGRLTGVGAAVTIAEIMNESKGDVTIYIASVEFGTHPRQKHPIGGGLRRRHRPHGHVSSDLRRLAETAAP
jgi:hypothetical protein